jgi:hypothetical protein
VEVLQEIKYKYPGKPVVLMTGYRRIVWFDRVGRVLRVEVPGRGYVADRVDPLR